jgi:hypothetical protein
MNRVTLLIVVAACAGLASLGCRGSSPVLGSVNRAAVSVKGDESMALGGPCVPPDELDEHFPGYEINEVSIDTGSNGCESGICLVNHMQGRVSCPYGQTAEQALNAPACFVPETSQPVRVAVSPQRMGRHAGVVSTCSCRCAGPGAGPFCECPSGMECAPLIEANEMLGNSDWAGSYCVAAGTTYNPSIETPLCQNAPNDCGDPMPY